VKASFSDEYSRKISARTKAALAIAKTRGANLEKPENLALEPRKERRWNEAGRAAADRAIFMPEILTACYEGAERVGVRQ
jgi:DNA invertase Pin-like site-specific DNA recombinase